MQSKITNQTNTEIELEITVGAEEFKKFFDKALGQLGQDLEVKGFRKGNAPNSTIEEQVGSERALMTAADLAVNDAYRRALAENKIEAIFYPKVEVKKLAKGDDFVFSTKTAVLPEIILPDYKKIVSALKKEPVAVSSEEMEKSLNWLAKSRSKLTVKEGGAKKGDFVEIEYVLSGHADGQPIKDGFILGEGRLLPGFENTLEGMSAGEEKKNIELDSGGKKFIVDVKMISVQKAERPELNDDFARSLGDFKDLESLKNNIRDGIILEKEQAEIQKLRFKMLEKIADMTNIELPEQLVENEQKQMMDGVKRQVADNLKVEFKDYLEKIQKTEEELMESFKAEAIKKIKNFLILKTIGEKENVTVSDEEVVVEVNKTLSRYPSEEEAEKDLGGNVEKLREYAREVIRNDKVFKILENQIT